MLQRGVFLRFHSADVPVSDAIRPSKPVLRIHRDVALTLSMLTSTKGPSAEVWGSSAVT